MSLRTTAPRRLSAYHAHEVPQTSEPDRTQATSLRTNYGLNPPRRTRPSVVFTIFEDAESAGAALTGASLADLARAQQQQRAAPTPPSEATARVRCIPAQLSTTQLRKDPRRRSLWATENAPQLKPAAANAKLALRASTGKGEGDAKLGGELGVAARVRRPRRASLLAAPRRGPLAPALRPVQEAREVEERDGALTGKENVAPGGPPVEGKAAKVRRSTALFGREDGLARTPRTTAAAKRPLSPPTGSPKVARLAASSSVRSQNRPTPAAPEGSWLAAQEAALTDLINSVFAARSPPPAPPPPAALLRALQTHHASHGFSRQRQRISASLRFGTLSLAPDSESSTEAHRFLRDVGRRARLVRALTASYARPFLRAALEAATSRAVPRSPDTAGPAPSTRDVTAFIEAVVLGNEDESAPAADTAGWAWRRTVLRVVEVVRLLDAAKEELALPGTLFRRGAASQSSTEVLAEVLAALHPLGRGAVATLAHLGARPAHVQAPLAGFDYALRNLAADARDGVRLARLVECVAAPARSRAMLDDGTPTRRTSADSLRSPARADGPFVTAHLRYPATSRAAMVGNNEVALRALRVAGGDGARLAAGVTPADLVDGHREKTVALLWGVVAECGIAGVLDWDEVEGEVARLEGRASHKADRGAEDCRDLLWRWARAVAARGGAEVDGDKVLEAAVDEYAPLIPSAQVHGSDGLAAKMRAIGYGPTFASLFSSGHDTAALLFLASRLLSGSRAERQRRAALKMLAAECATVVRTRARIESAACALQRAWRAGAEKRDRTKALAQERRVLDQARRRQDERLEVDFWMV